MEDLKQHFEYDEQTGIIRRKLCDGRTKPVGKIEASHGYVSFIFRGKSFLAHRVAWTLATGRPPVGQIDHINGIRTDNRLSNLRDVTVHENLKNKSITSRNKSGVMGVFKDKRSPKKWVAQIRFDKKTHHLGSFADLADAVAARKAAEKQFGFHPNHGKAGSP